MLRILLAVLPLVIGCETVGGWASTLELWVTEHGDVFECTKPNGSVVELCTDLSASELGEAIGARCDDTSRLWPLIFGCSLICHGEAPSGCNATSGCYCD